MKRIASENRTETAEPVSPVSFKKWLDERGRSTVTGWRWVQKGWLLKPLNIAGQPYLSPENIRQFNQRAAAGEFSQPHHGAAKQSADARATKLELQPASP